MPKKKKPLLPTIASNDEYVYKFVPNKTGYVLCQIKAKGDITVLCLPQNEIIETDDKVYMIELGIDNKRTGICRGIQRPFTGRNVVDTPNVLNKKEFRKFWIYCKDGVVTLGKKGHAMISFIDYKQQFKVKYFAFGNEKHNICEYIIDNEPIAPIGLELISRKSYHAVDTTASNPDSMKRQKERHEGIPTKYTPLEAQPISKAIIPVERCICGNTNDLNIPCVSSDCSCTRNQKTKAEQTPQPYQRHSPNKVRCVNSSCSCNIPEKDNSPKQRACACADKSFPSAKSPPRKTDPQRSPKKLSPDPTARSAVFVPCESLKDVATPTKNQSIQCACSDDIEKQLTQIDYGKSPVYPDQETSTSDIHLHIQISTSRSSHQNEAIEEPITKENRSKLTAQKVVKEENITKQKRSKSKAKKEVKEEHIPKQKRSKLKAETPIKSQPKKRHVTEDKNAKAMKKKKKLETPSTSATSLDENIMSEDERVEAVEQYIERPKHAAPKEPKKAKTSEKKSKQEKPNKKQTDERIALKDETLNAIVADALQKYFKESKTSYTKGATSVTIRPQDAKGVHRKARTYKIDPYYVPTNSGNVLVTKLDVGTQGAPPGATTGAQTLGKHNHQWGPPPTGQQDDLWDKQFNRWWGWQWMRNKEGGDQCCDRKQCRVNYSKGKCLKPKKRACEQWSPENIPLVDIGDLKPFDGQAKRAIQKYLSTPCSSIIMGDCMCGPGERAKNLVMANQLLQPCPKKENMQTNYETKKNEGRWNDACLCRPQGFPQQQTYKTHSEHSKRITCHMQCIMSSTEVMESGSDISCYNNGEELGCQAMKQQQQFVGMQQQNCCGKQQNCCGQQQNYQANCCCCCCCCCCCGPEATQPQKTQKIQTQKRNQRSEQTEVKPIYSTVGVNTSNPAIPTTHNIMTSMSAPDVQKKRQKAKKIQCHCTPPVQQQQQQNNCCCCCCCCKPKKCCMPRKCCGTNGNNCCNHNNGDDSQNNNNYNCCCKCDSKQKTTTETATNKNENKNEAVKVNNKTSNTSDKTKKEVKNIDSSKTVESNKDRTSTHIQNPSVKSNNSLAESQLKNVDLICYAAKVEHQRKELADLLARSQLLRIEPEQTPNSNHQLDEMDFDDVSTSLNDTTDFELDANNALKNSWLKHLSNTAKVSALLTGDKFSSPFSGNIYNIKPVNLPVPKVKTTSPRKPVEFIDVNRDMQILNSLEKNFKGNSHKMEYLAAICDAILSKAKKSEPTFACQATPLEQLETLLLKSPSMDNIQKFSTPEIKQFTPKEEVETNAQIHSETPEIKPERPHTPESTSTDNTVLTTKTKYQRRPTSRKSTKTKGFEKPAFSKTGLFAGGSSAQSTTMMLTKNDKLNKINVLRTFKNLKRPSSRASSVNTEEKLSDTASVVDEKPCEIPPIVEKVIEECYVTEPPKVVPQIEQNPLNIIGTSTETWWNPESESLARRNYLDSLSNKMEDLSSKLTNLAYNSYKSVTDDTTSAFLMSDIMSSSTSPFQILHFEKETEPDLKQARKKLNIFEKLWRPVSKSKGDVTKK